MVLKWRKAAKGTSNLVKTLGAMVRANGNTLDAEAVFSFWVGCFWAGGLHLLLERVLDQLLDEDLG